MNFPVVEEWRPFTLDGKQRMGGHVVSYANDFYFLTVRGSGHMLPSYKPASAYVMMKSFIQQTPFPRYVAPSKLKNDDDWESIL